MSITKLKSLTTNNHLFCCTSIDNKLSHSLIQAKHVLTNIRFSNLILQEYKMHTDTEKIFILFTCHSVVIRFVPVETQFVTLLVVNETSCLANTCSYWLCYCTHRRKLPSPHEMQLKNFDLFPSSALQSDCVSFSYFVTYCRYKITITASKLLMYPKEEANHVLIPNTI